MRDLNECLFPVELQKMPSDLSRRHFVRQAVPFGYVELDKHNGGILLNAGEGGLAVQAVRGVGSAELLRIRFQLIPCGSWIETSGRIAWTSASNTMAGIAFVDLPDESRLKIREWIFSNIENAEEQQAASADETPGDSDTVPGTPAASESHAENQKGDSVQETEAMHANSASPLPLIDLRDLHHPSPEKLPDRQSELPRDRAEQEQEQGRALWSNKSRRLMATAALIAILATVGWRLDSHRTPPEARIGLKLERAGSDLRLSWNPDTPVIANAVSARLQITDGDSHKLLDLDSSDLRGGAILYTPVTSDVVLKLEVDSRGAQAAASESVRISGAAAERALAAVIPSTKGTDPSTTEAMKREKRNSLALLQHNANASAQPIVKQSSGSGDSPSALPLEPGEASPASADLMNLYSALSAGAQPIGPFEPAHLIAKKDPVYPPLAGLDQHFTGVVQLSFHIRADGTVHDVNIVRGNPVLARAAVAAVQTWRYIPARRNGAPVDTEGRAILDFR